MYDNQFLEVKQIALFDLFLDCCFKSQWIANRKKTLEITILAVYKVF